MLKYKFTIQLKFNKITFLPIYTIAHTHMYTHTQSHIYQQKYLHYKYTQIPHTDTLIYTYT